MGDASLGKQRWYSGATRGQWMALIAALLGWAFDGFEMGIFPLVANPALVQLLGLSEKNRLALELGKQIPSLPEGERADKANELAELRAQVREPVRQWNALITAA